MEKVMRFPDGRQPRLSGATTLMALTAAKRIDGLVDGKRGMWIRLDCHRRQGPRLIPGPHQPISIDKIPAVWLAVSPAWLVVLAAAPLLGFAADAGWVGCLSNLKPHSAQAQIEANRARYATAVDPRCWG